MSGRGRPIVLGAATGSLTDEVTKLHRLATRVRRTTFSGRWDPESALIERDEIASALVGIAHALEQQPRPRTGGDQPMTRLLSVAVWRHCSPTRNNASTSSRHNWRNQPALGRGVDSGPQTINFPFHCRRSLMARNNDDARDAIGFDLLSHAASIVRDRRRSYGEPLDLFERVAARWSQVLRTKVTPAQVGLCLADLKLARLVHDPKHLDSLTDAAGYIALVHEVQK
jgi:hypothetical protein